MSSTDTTSVLAKLVQRFEQGPIDWSRPVRLPVAQ